jgi:magnesium-transporting ATPase (P-type)
VPLALGVLQILALDLATDTLSAVALGSERARPTVMQRGPVRGRLLDAVTAVRAFAILGPTEALTAFAAFLAVLAVGGWTVGDPPPAAGLLAMASGAYFVTVVLTQKANALACRSTRRTPWQLGWTTNRLLLVAGGVELVLAMLTLVTGLAPVLGQAPPGPLGWSMALAAAAALLLVDASWKAVRSRTRPV